MVDHDYYIEENYSSKQKKEKETETSTLRKRIDLSISECFHTKVINDKFLLMSVFGLRDLDQCITTIKEMELNKEQKQALIDETFQNFILQLKKANNSIKKKINYHF